MARAARGKKKNRTVSVDFTDVESGGGSSFRIAEGDYRMKVKEVEDTESGKGNDMFKFTFEGIEGKAKGKVFYSYCVYDPPDSLWKLKSLLEALGQEIPDGPLDLDLDELADLEMIGTVSDEDYDGKTVSRLTDFSSVDGDEEEEEDEDDDKKKAGKKKRGAKKADADEEEDEEDEDDKKKGAKKGAKKKGKKELEAKSADEVKAMDDDEMAELIETYELDVDLDDHKTPRRKASAIIAALEDKELLADD